MSKKKSGVLQFTAEDCRKKGRRLKKRCDYAKIVEAIDRINVQIKMSLAEGETKIKIGRTFNENIFPVLIYTYAWEKENSVFLSRLEWDILVKRLIDVGFTVDIDERTEYINLSWEEK